MLNMSSRQLAKLPETPPPTSIRTRSARVYSTKSKVPRRVPRNLLKADVQGAELQVLSCATRTLQETEIVILEVSLLAAMIGGPELSDVICRMKDLGFSLASTIALWIMPSASWT